MPAGSASSSSTLQIEELATCEDALSIQFVLVLDSVQLNFVLFF